MPLDAQNGNGPTIVVSNTEELREAYSTLASNGGGTILLEQGEGKYDLSLKGSANADDHVTITSADPDDPTVISRLSVNQVENVTIEGLELNSDGVVRDSWLNDLNVYESSNVEIRDCDFSSNASGFWSTSDPDAVRGATLGNIRESEDIVFSGNTVTDYFHGLGVFESIGVEISGNDISGIQADGIRMGGVQDVWVTDNHLHDFHGSTNTQNHDDMIQIWSLNADLVTRDVTISGNILNSGDGAASQSIFIGNESDKKDPTHIYENITITDNVIYNGHSNGIIVSAATNVTVADNTLLWNPNATMIANNSGPDGLSSAPGIRLPRVEDGRIVDNITSAVTAGSGVLVSGNEIVNYDNPFDENHIDNNIVNASGGEVDLRDLRILPDSDWAGQAGAVDSAPMMATTGGVEAVMVRNVAMDDDWNLTFDASLSIGPDGYLDEADYDFEWTFSDGTVLNGVEVERQYEGPGDHDVTLRIYKDGELADEIARDFVAAEKDYAIFDFENGIEDLSAFDSSIRYEDEAQLVSSDDGQGYLIGGSERIGLNRSNDQIHNLDSFGLELDIALADPDASGTFVHFHKVLKGSIDSEGSVKFTLITDKGDYSIISDTPIFTDGETHTLGFGFDGVNGKLVMMADGEEVGSTEAWGVTAPRTSYGLNFGNTFGDSVEAVIDNIYFGADPERAVGPLETDGNTGGGATDPDPVDPDTGGDTGGDTDGGDTGGDTDGGAGDGSGDGSSGGDGDGAGDGSNGDGGDAGDGSAGDGSAGDGTDTGSGSNGDGSNGDGSAGDGSDGNGAGNGDGSGGDTGAGNGDGNTDGDTVPDTGDGSTPGDGSDQGDGSDGTDQDGGTGAGDGSDGSGNGSGSDTDDGSTSGDGSDGAGNDGGATDGDGSAAGDGSDGDGSAAGDGSDDDDSGGFFAKIINALMSFFSGFGSRDGDDNDFVSISRVRNVNEDDDSLEKVVPVTNWLQEWLSGDEDETDNADDEMINDV